MIMYINSYTVKPGMMQQMVEELNATGAEGMFRSLPGNVMFQYAVAAGDPDTFILIDAWEDEAALQAHTVCDAMPLWHAVKDKYIIDKVIRRFDTV